MMNKRTTDARAPRAFALSLALTLVACAAVARTIRRDAPEPPTDRTTRPGLRLRARGVLSLGGYALNLTFDSAGRPRCVELVNRES